jgi:hypothetical protein
MRNTVLHAPRQTAAVGQAAQAGVDEGAALGEPLLAMIGQRDALDRHHCSLTFVSVR